MKRNGEPLSVCNLSDWCRMCIRFNRYYISRAMDMNWLWLTLLTPSPARISRTNEISPTWNYPFSTILLNLVLLEEFTLEMTACKCRQEIQCFVPEYFTINNQFCRSGSEVRLDLVEIAAAFVTGVWIELLH